jgi:hypothetical protein
VLQHERRHALVGHANAHEHVHGLERAEKGGARRVTSLALSQQLVSDAHRRGKGRLRPRDALHEVLHHLRPLRCAAAVHRRQRCA